LLIVVFQSEKAIGQCLLLMLSKELKSSSCIDFLFALIMIVH